MSTTVPSPLSISDQPRALAGDVLIGAHAIAEFLGIPSSKVYYLVALQRIPFFRLGSMICARKSVLLNWIRAQEQKNSRV